MFKSTFSLIIVVSQCFCQPLTSTLDMETFLKTTIQNVLDLAFEIRSVVQEAKKTDETEEQAILHLANQTTLVHDLVPKLLMIIDLLYSMNLNVQTTGIRLIIGSDSHENENEYIERPTRIAAIALVKMMTDLRTMIPMQRILEAADLVTEFSIVPHMAQMTTWHERSKSTPTHIQLINELGNLTFTFWVNSMVNLIRADPSLHERFQIQAFEAVKEIFEFPQINRSKFYVKLKFNESEIGYKLHSSYEIPIAPEFFPSRIFLKCVDPMFGEVDYDRYLFGRAIIEEAKKEVSLNEIFQNVMLNVSRITFFSEITAKIYMFAQLNRSISEHPVLAEQVKVAKDKLDIWYTFKKLRERVGLLPY